MISKYPEGRYGQLLVELLAGQVRDAKVIGDCVLPGGRIEESVGVDLADGTELYVLVQGWPPDG